MKKSKSLLIVFLLFLFIIFSFNSTYNYVLAENTTEIEYFDEEEEETEEEFEYKANYDDYANNQDDDEDADEDEEMDEIVIMSPSNQSSSQKKSSMIDAGEVDTDELTDWSISIDDDKDKDDFAFIKNSDQSDKKNNGTWMLYGGMALISLSVLGIFYVVISSCMHSKKINKKSKPAKHEKR